MLSFVAYVSFGICKIATLVLPFLKFRIITRLLVTVFALEFCRKPVRPRSVLGVFKFLYDIVILE